MIFGMPAHAQGKKMEEEIMDQQGLASLLKMSSGTVAKLGSVENYRELITPAARWIIAAKLLSVLSLRIAIRLNSLSLQKKFSIKWRHL